MNRLLIILLAALLLAGCTPASAAPETTNPETTVPETTVPETTVPETTVPEVSTLPEITAAPDPMDLLLESMTLQQKVGQLFIADLGQFSEDGVPVTAMSEALEEALTRYPVGGIILFYDNILTPEQITELNRGLQNAAPLPLFLAVDEEGGLVARLAKRDAFHLPKYESAAAVGASGDPADALDMGRTIGAYLDEYGFNLDFAPVADVNTNPRNPVIGTRAFSSDPEIAAQMAAAFRDGLREKGIIATFKHFPGHGDTAQDSHTGLAVSYRTRAQLEHCEWIPFRAASGMDFVMTAHVALPEITGDMTPSTLSHEVITGILREELGFEGLIVTDAMNMGAIVESYGAAEAAVAALQAGCDLILMPEDLEEAFGAVTTALEDGRLSMEWLDETVRRILEFKQLHGIVQP